MDSDQLERLGINPEDVRMVTPQQFLEESNGPSFSDLINCHCYQQYDRVFSLRSGLNLRRSEVGLLFLAGLEFAAKHSRIDNFRKVLEQEIIPECRDLLKSTIFTATQADLEPLKELFNLQAFEGSPFMSFEKFTKSAKESINSVQDSFSALCGLELEPSVGNESSTGLHPQTSFYTAIRKVLDENPQDALIYLRESLSKENEGPEARISRHLIRRLDPNLHGTLGTFKIFISSTFKDLKTERDSLRTQIIPSLQKEASEYGFQIQNIDLRWGVLERDSLDQRTMHVCLAEVQRCKATGLSPFIIWIIGQRLGWTPLPYSIPQQDVENVLPHLDVATKTLFDDWYKQDKNQISGSYILECISESQNSSMWHEQVAEPLRLGLLAAAIKAGSNALKFNLSISATGLEIVESLDNRESAFPGLVAFMNKMDQSEIPENILGLMGSIYEKFGTNWLNSYEDISDFESVVTDEVRTILRSEIDAVLQSKGQDEVDLQQVFVDDLRRNYFPREESVTELNQLLSSDSNKPCLVTGASGVGKSTLLAHWSEEVAARQNTILIRHFVGVTPASTSVSNLLRHLILQLIPHSSSLSQTDISWNLHNLSMQFRSLICTLKQDQEFIILVDGIDSLLPVQSSTSWIPSKVPDNVCLIISSASGQDDNLSSPDFNVFNLGLLEPSESEAILRFQFSQCKRILQKDQWKDLSPALHGATTPLQVRIIFAFLQSHRSWELIPQLPGTIDDLIASYTDNLVQQFGIDIVLAIISALCVARHGLTDDEICSILALDNSLWETYVHSGSQTQSGERRFPFIFWSRVRSKLDPMLSVRRTGGETMVNFRHPKIKSAFFSWIDSHSSLSTSATKLSNAFWMKEPWQEDNICNIRKQQELPYILSQTDTHLLYNVFTDLGYFESAVSSGRIVELLADIDQFQDFLPSNTEKSIVSVFRSAIFSESAFLENNPDTTYQILRNACWWPSKNSQRYPTRAIRKILQRWHSEKTKEDPWFTYVRALSPFPNAGAIRTSLPYGLYGETSHFSHKKNEGITSMAVSSEDSGLIAIGLTNRIDIRRAKTGETITKISIDDRHVESIHFFGKESVIAAVCIDNENRVSLGAWSSFGALISDHLNPMKSGQPTSPTYRGSEDMYI